MGEMDRELGGLQVGRMDLLTGGFGGGMDKSVDGRIWKWDG